MRGVYYGGHRYVEPDVLVVAEETRPRLSVRHVPFWELGRKGKGEVDG